MSLCFEQVLMSIQLLSVLIHAGASGVGQLAAP